MYRNGVGPESIETFDLSSRGNLNPQNRWVILSGIVPWEEAEAHYRTHFSMTEGSPSKPSRMALGALLIKERLNCSDEETVEQICENPYLQFFIGLRGYQKQAPFHPTMMVHFRKRFTSEMIAKINEKAVAKMCGLSKEEERDSEDGPSSPSQGESCSAESEEVPAVPLQENRGKLILDATCAPADITYPTDLKLLNQARLKSEAILDSLYFPVRKEIKKPRTYRLKARQLYLSLTKLKRVAKKQRRKGIGQQLRFLKRNLKHIEQLSALVSLEMLKKRQYRELLVIREIYRQQLWMYQNRENRIEGRIVSLSQPHVRPIVRGKVNATTEFGAKLSASLSEGYFFLDHFSWNAFNESGQLREQVESFRSRFGCYPESLHVDQIYRTRENRKFCKQRGIRLSGPPLGRPLERANQNQESWKQQKKIARQDELDRIAIEGKFGQAKRRFSLDRIRTKLPSTSQCTMALIFLLINLEKGLAFLFFGSFLFETLRQFIKQFLNPLSPKDREKAYVE